MPKPHGKPKQIEAKMESSKQEDQEQPDNPSVPQETEQEPEAAANAETFQSDEWWSATPLAPEWTEPETETTAADVIPTRETATTNVYFC